MAIIHNTTMSPSMLELLRVWLPAQPWYLKSGRGPELTKAGGFRLDDPAGEVGIEFMVVTDGSGNPAITYQVPLTYRAGALAGDRELRRCQEQACSIPALMHIFDATEDMRRTLRAHGLDRR